VDVALAKMKRLPHQSLFLSLAMMVRALQGAQFTESALQLDPATTGSQTSLSYEFQLDLDLQVGDAIILRLPGFSFGHFSLPSSTCHKQFNVSASGSGTTADLKLVIDGTYPHYAGMRCRVTVETGVITSTVAQPRNFVERTARTSGTVVVPPSTIYSSPGLPGLPHGTRLSFGSILSGETTSLTLSFTMNVPLRQDDYIRMIIPWFNFSFDTTDGLTNTVKQGCGNALFIAQYSNGGTLSAEVILTVKSAAPLEEYVGCSLTVQDGVSLSPYYEPGNSTDRTVSVHLAGYTASPEMVPIDISPGINRKSMGSSLILERPWWGEPSELAYSFRLNCDFAYEDEVEIRIPMFTFTPGIIFRLGPNPNPKSLTLSP